MLQRVQEACILSRKRQSPWRNTGKGQGLEGLVDGDEGLKELGKVLEGLKDVGDKGEDLGEELKEKHKGN